MSEFRVEVVRIGRVEKHPNADTLSVARVLGDYPVIIRTGQFHEGDLAVYLSVDAVVPQAERFAFLGEHRRIKAKKLRGVFSMGLLVEAESDMREGENVQERLGVTKYEPVEHFTMHDEDECDLGGIPVFTDVEGLRRWPDVLQVGEPVQITEKIHGACARYCWRDGRLWVGSRTRFKRESATNLWWKAARESGIEAACRKIPGVVVYGEVYGQVQDLRYGLAGVSFKAFDAFDTRGGHYLDAAESLAICATVGLATVPLLYTGPWGDECRRYAEGQSTLAAHVREGFVVRPARERWRDDCGRVIFKLVGEGYHTRKGG